MLKLTTSCGALAFFLIVNVQSMSIPTARAPEISIIQARGLDDWQHTLSNDTRQRLDVARQHLDDESAPGQAFRNDTIMRVNIEREALNLSLIDLSQAFGITLLASRAAVTGVGVNKRSNAEDFREEAYLRSGTMTYPSVKRRSNAEDFREEAYLRTGTMTYPSVKKRSNAEDFREEAYLRSGTMTYPSVKRRSNAEDFREEAYLRTGTMTYPSVKTRSNAVYSSLLNSDNLAIGAIERINIAHRVLGQPELTIEQAKEIGSHGDEYVSEYWHSSINHGGFWSTDQAAGKPNFIEGGQANGFGFTQSTFHKLHCLANLRMMLAWHITGNGDKMTRDMNVHAIHCLEYIRSRELKNSDLNEEPIDTIDYKGMGIH